jgi:hypothetical protein
MSDDEKKKRRWIKLIVSDDVSDLWTDGSVVTIALGRCGPGLVTLYTDAFTLALGVHEADYDVYLPSGPPQASGVCHPDCLKGTSTHCFRGWIWGRATEAYDMCLEYFGLGPIVLVCWRP